MGYEKPTPVQEMTIPIILENHDLIACAQTGTGKTAAYILPLLNKIVVEHTRHLNTLVIAPTRELALQIDQQVEGFAYFLGVSSLSVYGGSDGATWDQQRKAMESGADIIVATPGRLISLLAMGKMDFSHLRHLVLDAIQRRCVQRGDEHHGGRDQAQAMRHLGIGQAPVQAGHDDTGLRRRQQQLKILAGVLGQHRDPVACAQAPRKHRLRQAAGDPVDQPDGRRFDNGLPSRLFGDPGQSVPRAELLPQRG